MPSSRTENTVRNIAWGSAYKFVALAGPFVVRMLLIWQLGATYLGLSGFFTSILQVLNLAELGFSS
ncbi:MAG: polysaccharide biosynthesis protein, partial [Eggerthellaceae bacterium]|nr:polysaccharide biosynthesis protein [Eggerthellaceae bacterium]